MSFYIHTKWSLETELFRGKIHKIKLEVRDSHTGKVLYCRPLNKCQESAFSVIFNNLSDKMDKQRFDKINNRPVWGQAGYEFCLAIIGRQSISEQIRQAVWLSDFMLEPRFWPRFIIFRFKIIYRLMVNTHLHNKIFDILQNFQFFSNFWRPDVTWRRWASLNCLNLMKMI